MWDYLGKPVDALKGTGDVISEIYGIMSRSVAAPQRLRTAFPREGLSRRKNRVVKEEPIEVGALVKEALPNARFWVELEDGHKVLAYVAGKLRKMTAGSAA